MRPTFQLPAAFRTLALAAFASQAHAFTPTPFVMRGAFRPHKSFCSTPSLRSSKSTWKMATTPIQITGNNIELTPALKDYVTNKFSNALSKVGRRVTKCDVHLVYDKNPAVPDPNHVEVTLFAKGATIRAHKNTHDMYAAIDECSDTIRRKLRKYKERLIDSHRSGAAEAADLLPEEIESFLEFNAEVEQQMTDNSVAEVLPVDLMNVKKKTFNMDPISLEEAVLCLEYIDHDFYVFKNKDNSGKVTVVYNRKSGGVGLIEPE